MDNGLYLLRVTRAASAAQGVALLRDGTLLGGDSLHWWEGAVTSAGETFSGELTVHKHAPGPSIFGFFAFDLVTLALAGARAGTQWRAEARSSAATAAPLDLSLRLLRPA
jgi:hypothetical protein